jgi:NAD(P)-dependent dehydrogenase (short-subunit alcohol dehydrogenase family)
VTTVGIATGAGRGMGRACATRLADTVDHLILVDLDESTLADAATALSSGSRAVVEAIALDVTDRAGVQRLADRVTELGTLRSVAHAAGISPTMADWRRIFTVDLIGTALLAEALRPLATVGTAMVCFSSMAAKLGVVNPDPKAVALFEDPLDEALLDRLHDVLGPVIEDSGFAYAWAKYGVQRFVQSEAVRLGAVGARICSVSPGIIDTPQGQQEAAAQDVMASLVDLTPLGRMGTADELAAVVAFLLSEEAAFLSGTDVLVDGGVCAALTSQSTLDVAGR